MFLLNRGADNEIGGYWFLINTTKIIVSNCSQIRNFEIFLLKIMIKWDDQLIETSAYHSLNIFNCRTIVIEEQNKKKLFYTPWSSLSSSDSQ